MQPDDHQNEPAPIVDPLGPDPTRAVPPTVPGFIAAMDLAVDGDAAIEWLSGEIDVSVSEQATDLGVLALADPRVDALVLDLSQVTFIDSTGLGALIELRTQAQATDKAMRLRGVPPPVSKLLELTGLDDVFGVPHGDAGRC